VKAVLVVEVELSPVVVLVRCRLVEEEEAEEVGQVVSVSRPVVVGNQRQMAVELAVEVAEGDPCHRRIQGCSTWCRYCMVLVRACDYFPRRPIDGLPASDPAPAQSITVRHTAVNSAL